MTTIHDLVDKYGPHVVWYYVGSLQSKLAEEDLRDSLEIVILCAEEDIQQRKEQENAQNKISQQGQ